jgi:hypothetical protein
LSREINHYLFPDYTTILISQVVGLIENDQFDPKVFSPIHGVVELIAEDFGGTHDYWCLMILLAIAGENPHIFWTKVLAELGILGIGQRFERRGIPTPAIVGQQLLHSLKGNPGLARSGCGGNEHIALVDSEHSLLLEGVRNKGRSFGNADSL